MRDLILQLSKSSIYSTKPHFDFELNGIIRVGFFYALRLMISWIASTIFGVHYPLRNIRICQTVLRRRLRIIASSGQAIFQGKQQNYVMLTGLSINFHLHYLDALKKNLIAIAVVISLLIVLIIRIAVRQGHLPFVMSAMPLKTSPPRILMRDWNRHAFPLSWSNWLSRSII
jgi:hypothetical protein